jgi:hypothetical protein
VRGIVDLIIGAFIAFLPLFFLLLRRRRVAGSPGGTAAGPTTDLAPQYETSVDEIPGSEAPAEGMPPSRVPAAAPPPASVWERVNRLSPGRRAIVMAEIISKPLALRDRQPWV